MELREKINQVRSELGQKIPLWIKKILYLVLFFDLGVNYWTSKKSSRNTTSFTEVLRCRKWPKPLLYDMFSFQKIVLFVGPKNRNLIKICQKRLKNMLKICNYVLMTFRQKFIWPLLFLISKILRGEFVWSPCFFFLFVCQPVSIYESLPSPFLRFFQKKIKTFCLTPILQQLI